VTGEPFYRTIVEETLDYVVREMTSPEGGFYSTQDADSEGEEAKFFVWTPDEIRAVLGDQADPFLSAYDVTERGNLEGKNILELVGSVEERKALAEAMIEHFRAPKGFYDTIGSRRRASASPRLASGRQSAAAAFFSSVTALLSMVSKDFIDHASGVAYSYRVGVQVVWDEDQGLGQCVASTSRPRRVIDR
jgi:uncharacterized protein YyaL (SSP411 family)